MNENDTFINKTTILTKTHLDNETLNYKILFYNSHLKDKITTFIKALQTSLLNS